LQRSRAWSDEEWRAAIERLHAQGLVESDGSFTNAGRAKRDEIEHRTDVLAMKPWDAIGEESCTRLRELVRPWSRAIVSSGGSLASALDDATRDP
jgi:hypothetical protein